MRFIRALDERMALIVVAFVGFCPAGGALGAPQAHTGDLGELASFLLPHPPFCRFPRQRAHRAHRPAAPLRRATRYSASLGA
jgi:hypothetical protein